MTISDRARLRALCETWKAGKWVDACEIIDTARTALPELLGDVDRLEKEVARLNALNASICDDANRLRDTIEQNRKDWNELRAENTALRTALGPKQVAAALAGESK